MRAHRIRQAAAVVSHLWNESREVCPGIEDERGTVRHRSKLQTLTLSKSEVIRMVLRITPLIVASLLLAAHFLRSGNLGLVIASLLVPLLLVIKKRWSLIIVQLFAYLGVVIWVITTISIVRQRMLWGIPWSGVVIILGAVALFTGFAGLLLNSAVVKEKYPSD